MKLTVLEDGIVQRVNPASGTCDVYIQDGDIYLTDVVYVRYSTRPGRESGTFGAPQLYDQVMVAYNPSSPHRGAVIMGAIPIASKKTGRKKKVGIEQEGNWGFKSDKGAMVMVTSGETSMIGSNMQNYLMAGMSGLESYLSMRTVSYTLDTSALHMYSGWYREEGVNSFQMAQMAKKGGVRTEVDLYTKPSDRITNLNPAFSFKMGNYKDWFWTMDMGEEDEPTRSVKFWAKKTGEFYLKFKPLPKMPPIPVKQGESYVYVSKYGKYYTLHPKSRILLGNDKRASYKATAVPTEGLYRETKHIAKGRVTIKAYEPGVKGYSLMDFLEKLVKTAMQYAFLAGAAGTMAPWTGRELISAGKAIVSAMIKKEKFGKGPTLSDTVYLG